MSVYPYGHEIEKVLATGRATSSKVVLIFDRYTALQSKAEQEAFVLALAAELLVSRARLNGQSESAGIMHPDQVPLSERRL